MEGTEKGDCICIKVCPSMRVCVCVWICYCLMISTWLPLSSMHCLYPSTRLCIHTYSMCVLCVWACTCAYDIYHTDSMLIDRDDVDY